MKYSAIRKCDIANGPGIRLSLWVSGCRNRCKGCFQPETWSFDYGAPYTDEVKERILNELSKEYYTGFTILGGDPFEPENIGPCTDLCKAIRAIHPRINIWVYTGYYYEDIKDNDIFNYIDVLVDSPFSIDKRDYSSSFRGSTNQRIIKIVGGHFEGFLQEGH